MTGTRAFGLLLVDKPVGPTSHDVISQIRRMSGVRKVGHSGTLDPLASGLLVVCIGPATRLSEYLTRLDKRYQADIQFGVATDSHDAAGQVTLKGGRIPERGEIEECLDSFRGSIEQIPPAFSAIKVKGKKAYELARAGHNLKLVARPVIVNKLDLIRYHPPNLKLDIQCSSGTYIRSLARDLGIRLGTHAHITGLRRNKVGNFKIEQARTMEELSLAFQNEAWRDYLISPVDGFPDFPKIIFGLEKLEDIRHGRPVQREVEYTGLALGLSQEGKLVAIIETSDVEPLWHPRKVFLA